MNPLADIDPLSVGNNLQTWTQNNGLAVVLLFIGLAAGAYATIKVTRWVGVNILIPMKEAAIEHLRKTDATLKHLRKTDATLTSVSATMQDMSMQLREIKGEQTRIIQCHEDLRGRIHCQLKTPQAGT